MGHVGANQGGIDDHISNRCTGRGSAYSLLARVTTPIGTAELAISTVPIPTLLGTEACDRIIKRRTDERVRRSGDAERKDTSVATPIGTAEGPLVTVRVRGTFLTTDTSGIRIHRWTGLERVS